MNNPRFSKNESLKLYQTTFNGGQCDKKEEPIGRLVYCQNYDSFSFKEPDLSSSLQIITNTYVCKHHHRIRFLYIHLELETFCSLCLVRTLLWVQSLVFE